METKKSELVYSTRKKLNKSDIKQLKQVKLKAINENKIITK